MIPNSNTPEGNEGADKALDNSALDSDLQKQDSTKPQNEETDSNDPRVETVVPDNDN